MVSAPAGVPETGVVPQQTPSQPVLGIGMQADEQNLTQSSLSTNPLSRPFEQPVVTKQDYEAQQIRPAIETYLSTHPNGGIPQGNPNNGEVKTYRPNTTLDNVKLGAKFLVSKPIQGIEEAAAGAGYLLNKIGAISDEKFQKGNRIIAEGPVSNMGLDKEYRENGPDNRFVQGVGGLAKIAPAMVMAAPTYGASFYLQNAGAASEQVQKMKDEGIKFNNHAEDLYVNGSGIIGYLLGKGVGGLVMSKMGTKLANDVVGNLSAEAIKEVADLGAKATTQDIANVFVNKAMTFSQKLGQLGLDAIKQYPKIGLEFAGANLAGSGFKAAANKLSGNNPFGEVTGDEIAKDVSSPFYNGGDSNGDIGSLVSGLITAPAAGLSLLHLGSTAGMLFDKSPFKNAVIDNLQRDSSPESVQQIKDQLINIGKNKGWSDDELHNTLTTVDALADITKSIPKDLRPDKFNDATNLILGRRQLEAVLGEVQKQKEGIDPALSGKAEGFEKLLTAKIEQANDKLNELVTDKSYTYSEENGKYFKTKLNEEPIEITKERYDLEEIENKAKPKDQQSKVISGAPAKSEAKQEPVKPVEPEKATPAATSPVVDTSMMDDLDSELEAFKQSNEPAKNSPNKSDVLENLSDKEIKDLYSDSEKRNSLGLVPRDLANEQEARKNNNEQETENKPTQAVPAKQPEPVATKQPEAPVASVNEKVNDNLKTKEENNDAISKQISGKVGVREPSAMGEGVGEPNQSEIPTGKGKQSEEVQSNEEKPRFTTKGNGLEPKYYKNIQGEFIETPGKLVPNDHGLDLFVHDNADTGGSGFGVTEGSTGLNIGKGATEAAAIEAAKSVLSTKTPAEMQAIIKSKQDAGAKSPRGNVKPAEAAKGPDTENTEAVIAKATATVRKAKATERRSTEQAGVVNEIDNAIKEIDKELESLGADKNATPPEDEGQEPESTEPPPSDKKSKRAKFEQELKDAKKAFMDTFNKALSGVNPETIEKGIKLLAVYAKIGIHDFKEIASELAADLGESFRDIFEGFKASYGAFASQEATDEQLDQMTDIREVRKLTVDEFIPKKEDNATGNEHDTVGENTPAVSKGEPAGQAAGNVSKPESEKLPGQSDGSGGEAGNGKRSEDVAKSAKRSGDGSVAGSGGSNDRVGRGSSGDTGRPVPENTSKRTVAPEDRNHVINPSDEIVPSGTVAKVNANMDALFTLQKLEKENRNPTPEEKKVLAKFVGWGGLAKYLNAPDYKDNNAVSAVVNGKRETVFNSSYRQIPLDFTRDGALDLTKFDSFDSLVKDIKEKLSNAGYSISTDNVRPALVKAMMSPTEYQDAINSTINAHYTDRQIITKMWDIARQLGFEGGKTLETSAGIGHFFGLLPKELQGKTALTGYELDSITGRMFKKLYPEANITVGGFEHAKVAPNSQDLVIGNVPFAAKAPYDKNYPELSKFSMHNYFIAKSLKLLKPGGVSMVITSSSTMDAPISTKFREWAGSPEGGNSYLIGAIRLPNNAFAENAGTQVTTDLVIFQKKGQVFDPSLDNPFRYTKLLKEGTDKYDNVVPLNVNEYYHEHPENMLGEMMTAHEAGTGGLYGGDTPTLQAPAGMDVMKAFDKAARNLPTGIIGERQSVINNTEPEQVIPADKKEGAMFVKNGKVFQVNNEVGSALPLDAKQQKMAIAYVGLKTSLLDLIKLEQSKDASDAQIDSIRAALNKDYDAFVKAHGNLNARTANFLNDNDIDFPIVSSIERTKDSLTKGASGKDVRVTTITKGDILTKRINFPRVEPTEAGDVKDAINISLNYRNGLDLDYMAKMLKSTPEEIKDRLLKDELAYENPDTGILETPDEYLSGYVRDKLKRAEQAATIDPKYKKNVEELKKVIPKEIPASLISYSLGSSWIPAQVYQDFVKDKFAADVTIKYLDRSGKFSVQIRNGRYSAQNLKTYSAGGVEGLDLFEATMNNVQVVVNDTVLNENGNKVQVKNPDKTAAAQAMQQQLQDEFGDPGSGWIYQNEAHKNETQTIYNDIFNGQVLRDWRLPDFDHYPGASHEITLYEHQKRAISRNIAESTLDAHEVGSGKTFTMITTAMEMRRLGTARKPMIAVQNATLGQIIKSFYDLYPSAKILAPTPKDMEAAGRKRFFGKIATGDWDAIIIPHSQLSMIPDDPERQKAYIQEQIDEMIQVMNESDDRIEKNKMKREIEALQTEMGLIGMVDENGNPLSAKAAKAAKSNAKAIGEKALKIEAGLRKALDRKTDNLMNFEQLGVDALLIDEAHKYKRLGFQTSMKNIKGIDTSKSQRSQSVLLKTRWVQEKTGGKNVIFLTGTPISNTMAEAWTMLKYVRPDILNHMGIEYFDQFAKTFGQVIPSLEQTGGGTFKIQSRFAKFQNLPEFITAFRAATDVVLSDDVKEFQNGKIPKLKNGKMTGVVVPQTPELKAQIADFRKTLEWFDQLSGSQKREYSWIPLVTFTKAKQSAIDLRLLSPDNVDSPGSKVNMAVKNIIEKYRETKASKGTQMVFSDMYQSPDPKNQYLDEDGIVANPAYGKPRFNLFQDMKDKLVANGIPANEIAIITEPQYENKNGLKKNALFDDVNAGKVRVVFGTTEKMGVGVNAQKKLVALHHLDAPARPMDFTQRNGRILRQGNENSEVDVLTYGVEKTLDSSAFHRLSFKQRFINQIMKGKNLERVTEDPADEAQLTFDEMMAQLSDSPYAMQKLLVDNKLQSEIRKQSNFKHKIVEAGSALRSAENSLRNRKAELADELVYAKKVSDNFPDGNITSLKATGLPEATEKFGAAADQYLEKLYKRYSESPTKYAKGMIEVNGVPVELEFHNRQEMSKETKLLVDYGELYYTVPEVGIVHDGYGRGIHVYSGTGAGLIQSLRSRLNDVLVEPANTNRKIKNTEADIEQLQKDVRATFDDSKLKELQAESESLKNKMLNEKPSPDDNPDGGGQSVADYVKDQSNIKPALDFLDKMKAKNDGRFMSSIVPIPPAVWNGAIDVMKNILKATNSTQKAIRVAARYIIDRGGSEAQAKDFSATMAEKMAATPTGKTATAPDTEDIMTEENMIKSAEAINAKIDGSALSPDENDLTSLDLTKLTKKELHRYIEIAAVLAVDPQGVLTKDVTDLVDRVANRLNPKSGTAVPPPPTPPNDNGGLMDDEEPEEKKRIPKKEKLPMQPTDSLPPQDGPDGKPTGKENYSAFGRLKDIRVRNLEQLKQFGVDNGDMQALRDVRQYATSKSQSSIVMKTATDRILKLVGKDGWNVLRQALVESRLRGIKKRWDNWSQQIMKSSDNEIDDLFEDGSNSLMYDVVSRLDGYEDDSKPEQTILGMISNGQYDDAREYMRDMFENAANNVAFFDKLSNGKTFDEMVSDDKFTDPKMQEALEAYKSLLAKPFQESHAANEGIFSDALGPLDAYYPLVPTGADKHFVVSGGAKYKAPENPNNKFATGQGNEYSTALSDLSSRLATAFRTSNKANAIRSLENAGLMAKVSKDSPDTGLIDVNGEVYTAQKVLVQDSRLVTVNGKTTSIPARYVLMPKWLYREVKPIFEDTGSLADDFSLFGRINNVGIKLMLGGPIEATSHSYRLLGGIVNSMPYMQEWAYKNGVLGHAGGLVLNNPFVKTFAGMGHILFTDISSEEALAEIQEMAKLGIIPEKTWQKTWSKEFAELTGAKKVPVWDFSPILYGKNSFDLKARVMLYRLSKAMNPEATPEQIVTMQNELGNYTQSLQGDLEKLVKKHGLAPFYSFGGAIYRSGLRAIWGGTHLPLTRPSLKEAFTTKLGAEQMGKLAGYKMAQLLSAGIIGLIGYWALTYHTQTKKWPWEDKSSKLLRLPFPKWAQNEASAKMFTDKKGNYKDVDFSFFNPFLNRGIRAAGLPAAYETYELGGTAGQALEAGTVQAINTNISPYTSSPAVNMGVTALTGDAPYITSIRDKYAGTPGLGLYRKVNTFSPGLQIPANLAVAATGLNPIADYALSPVTGALKYNYSSEDNDAFGAAQSVFNTILPHLFTPHGNDAGKSKAIKKQQKAINTSMKKEQKKH